MMFEITSLLQIIALMRQVKDQIRRILNRPKVNFFNSIFFQDINTKNDVQLIHASMCIHT